MAYTMAADSAQLETLASTLTSTSSDIGTGITGIIDTATAEDSNVWSGAGFTAFSDGVKKYSDALNTLPDAINCFSTSFKTIAGEAETLVSGVDSALEQIQ